MKQYVFFSMWKTSNTKFEASSRRLYSCKPEEKAQRFMDWLKEVEGELNVANPSDWMLVNCKIIE